MADIFLIDTEIAKREVAAFEKSLETIQRSLDNFDKRTSFKRIERALEQLSTNNLGRLNAALERATNKMVEHTKHGVELGLSEYERLVAAYGSGRDGRGWIKAWLEAKAKFTGVLSDINKASESYAEARTRNLQREAKLQVTHALSEANKLKAAYTAIKFVAVRGQAAKDAKDAEVPKVLVKYDLISSTVKNAAAGYATASEVIVSEAKRLAAEVAKLEKLKAIVAARLDKAALMENDKSRLLSAPTAAKQSLAYAGKEVAGQAEKYAVAHLKSYYAELERVEALKDRIRSKEIYATKAVAAQSLAYAGKDIAGQTDKHAIGAMRDYYTQLQMAGDSVAFVHNRSKDLTTSTGAVGSQMATTAAKTKELSGAFKKLQIDGNDLHSLSRGLASSFGLLWLTWGNLVPLFAGAAVSAGIKKAFDIGSEVEYNIKFMEVLGSVSKESAGAVRQALRDIDQETMFSVKELSAQMVVLGQAGYSTTDSIKSLRPVADLAASGMVDLSTATETMIRVQNMFGLSTDDAAKTASKLFVATKSAPLTVKDLAESLKYASTSNIQYGQTLEEVLSLLGAMSKVGLKGSIGGTGLANLLQDLSVRSGPARLAVGNLEKAVNNMRAATDKPWKFSLFTPEGGKKSAIQLIEDLQTQLQKLKPESALKFINALTTERGARGFFAALADGTVKLREFKKELENVNGDEAFLAAKGLMETAKGALEMLKSSMAGVLDRTFELNADGYKNAILTVRSAIESEAFRGAIGMLVGGFTGLVSAILAAKDALVLLAVGFVGFKVGAGIQAALGATALGLMNISARADAAAISLARMGTASTTAALAASAAASLASRGMAAAAGFLVNPLVGLITTVGVLGATWYSGNKVAKESLQDTTNDVLTSTTSNITQYQKEIDKIRELRGLKNSDPYSAVREGLDAARAEIDNKRSNKDKLESRSNNVPAAQKERILARVHILNQEIADEEARLAGKIKIYNKAMTDDAVASADKEAAAAKKTAAARQAAAGTLDLSGGAAGRATARVKAYTDTFSKISQLMNAELETSKQMYADDEHVLKLHHEREMVSDAAFFARKHTLLEAADAKERSILDAAIATNYARYNKEQADAKGNKENLERLDEAYYTSQAQVGEKLSRLYSRTAARRLEASLPSVSVNKAIKAAEAEIAVISENDAAQKRLAATRQAAEKQGPLAVARLEAETAAYDKFTKSVLGLEEQMQLELAIIEELMAYGPAQGDTINQHAAAYNRLAVALEKVRLARSKSTALAGADAEADALSKKYAAEQAKLADSYEKLSQDVGDQLFDAITGKGKDAAGKLREYLKSALLQPFKILLQPVLGAIGSTIAGLLLPGGAAAASMGFGSAAGGAIAGGAGGALTGILAGAGAALSTFGTAALASAQSMLGMTGTFAQFSALTQSTFAAATGGSTLAGTLGSAAGPAAVVVAALAALGAFRTTKKVSGGLQGTLGGGEDGIHTYDLMRKSGYLLGGPQYKAVDTGVYEFSQQVQNSFDVLKRSTLGMAESLGLSTDALQNFTTRLGSDLIHPDTGGYGIELKDLTPEEAQKKVEEALATANNELAQRILGSFKTTTSVIEDTISEMTGYGDEANLVLKKVSRTVEESTYATSEYALHGEKAIDTLTRLATSLATANGAFDMLGYDLVGTGVKAADAASKIITAFGGLEKFSASMQSYYTNFYSEQERRDVANRQIAAELTRVGIQTTAEQVSNATFAQYRAGVEAIKAQYGADSKQFATAVNLSAQFAEANRPAQEAAPVTAATVSDSLTPAQEAAKKQQETLANMATEQTTLQVSLLRAQGKETEALALELADYSEINKAAYIAQLAVNDALKEQIRIQNSINTLNETTKTTQISLLEAQGQTLAAYALQTNKLSDAEKSISDYNRVLQLQIDTVNNVKSSMKSYLTASEYMHQQLGTMALRLQQGGFSQSINELIQILAGTSKDDLLKFFLTIKDTAPEAAAAVAAISADFSAMRDAQTAEVQALRSKATQNYLDAQNKVTEAQKAVASVLQTTLQGFHSYLDELNNSTTGIKGTDSLAASRKRFEELADKALKGDTSVIPQLQPAAKAFLDLSKGFSSSVTDYRLDLSAVKIVFTKMEELGKTALDKLPAAVVSDTDAINAAYTQLGLAVRAEFEARRVANAVQASLTDTTKDLVTQYREAIAVLPNWSDALVQLDKVLNVDYEALLVDTLKGYIPDMGVGFSTVELFEKTVKETVPSMGEGFDSSQLYLNKLTEKIPSMGEGFDLSTLVTGGFAATLAARVPSMGASFNLAAMAQSAIDAAVARMVANTPAPVAPIPAVTTPAPVTTTPTVSTSPVSTTSAVSTSPVSTTTVSGSSPSSAYQQLLTTLSGYSKVADPGGINDNWWRHVTADTRELGLGATDLARALQSGVTGSFLTSSTVGSVQTIARSLNLPAFASGGYHTGGVALVGEEGPELVNMGPSRIYNAGDTQRMLGGAGNEELIAEIRLLNNRIVELERSMKEGLYPIARNTRETSEKVVKWDGDGMPPVRT